jgi:signal transduction histidine kinase
MKRSNLNALSERYAKALGKHLRRSPKAGLRSASDLGKKAVALGLDTLGLARMHERAFVNLERSGGSDAFTRRAELFFAEALTPIVATHRAARQTRAELNRLKRTLARRTTELAATHRHLARGIVRRQSVEAALEKSGEHYARLLKESLQLQEGLRRLTHQLLMAQEDERKKISCELRDEVAQTLLGINARLLALKQEAWSNTAGLKTEIASTQRLVAKSADSVRRVARNFRNA